MQRKLFSLRAATIAFAAIAVSGFAAQVAMASDAAMPVRGEASVAPRLPHASAGSARLVATPTERAQARRTGNIGEAWQGESSPTLAGDGRMDGSERQARGAGDGWQPVRGEAGWRFQRG